MKAIYKEHELQQVYKDYLDSTKAALEIAKLRQEVETLNLQNANHKSNKIMSIIAISISALLGLKELMLWLISL